ncbi:heme-binding protein soul2 [Eucyclogobius newberryi]|uniref:heme-binding protein soul2 n=1 Tax=Eucyclogobius newberryi TaxID=166745 RepID=UPI003B5C96AB
MKTPVVPLIVALAVALVLGFTRPAQAWDQLDFCQGKVCPQFTRTAEHQSYEERLYEASAWMCTQVSGTTVSDVTSAHDRLKDFAKREAVSDTWPALVRQEQGENGPRYEMCWMVPPDASLANSDEGPVKVKPFPCTTVFVRSFGGLPSLERGQQNAELLKVDLEQAGESFDRTSFCGAGYDSFFSLAHHNELWICSV